LFQNAKEENEVSLTLIIVTTVIIFLLLPVVIVLTVKIIKTSKSNKQLKEQSERFQAELEHYRTNPSTDQDYDTLDEEVQRGRRQQTKARTKQAKFQQHRVEAEVVPEPKVSYINVPVHTLSRDDDNFSDTYNYSIAGIN